MDQPSKDLEGLNTDEVALREALCLENTHNLIICPKFPWPDPRFRGIRCRRPIDV